MKCENCKYYSCPLSDGYPYPECEYDECPDDNDECEYFAEWTYKDEMERLYGRDDFMENIREKMF